MSSVYIGLQDGKISYEEFVANGDDEDRYGLEKGVPALLEREVQQPQHEALAFTSI